MDRYVPEGLDASAPVIRPPIDPPTLKQMAISTDDAVETTVLHSGGD